MTYRDDPRWQAAHAAFMREDYETPAAGLVARALAVMEMYRVELLWTGGETA